MLGVARLPDKGDYLVPLEKYTKQSKNGGVGTPEEFYKKLMRVTTRPWSKKEFPILADWLAANEKPVALLVEASKRPRRYEPLISGDGSVLCTLCPSGTQDREAARALAARAMLRLGEGKLSETWGDLLALHRLARLTGQGPTLIDSCIGSALEMEAFAGDRAVLEHIRLTAAQAAKMRNDLANLPPTPKVADKIDVGERFTYLDSVERLARGPLDKGVGDELGWKLKELFNSAPRSRLDWDQVLRMGNSWYDRLVDAARKPTRAERQRAFFKIDDDLRDRIAEAKSWKLLLRRCSTGGRLFPRRSV